MRYYLGIDPGLSGALAFYDPAADELKIWDMPTFNVKVAGKNRRALDITGLANIIDPLAQHVIMAAVEEVGAMPKQGVTSSFSFGFAAGCAQMAVAAYFIAMTPVRPAVWKRRMGLTANKTNTRREASRLLPKHAGLWPLVKHDGRAEAALLAYYIAKQQSNKGV